MEGLNLGLLKQKRKDSGLSLQEMANLLGYTSPSSYLKLEDGKSDFKANHLPVICEKLKCELNELFFANDFADLAKTDNLKVKSGKVEIDLSSFLKNHLGEENGIKVMEQLAGELRKEIHNS